MQLVSIENSLSNDAQFSNTSGVSSAAQCFSAGGRSFGIDGQSVRKNWTLGYVSCEVNTVERYSRGAFQTESFWYGEACLSGRAHGAGYARWCLAGQQCDSNSASGVLMLATGVANIGSLAECPIEIRGRSIVFKGRISPSGELEGGKLNVYGVSAGSTYLAETFVGRFRPGNNYSSGAFHYRGKTYISGAFGSGNLIRGEALVIEASGETYLANCDGLRCTKIDAPLRLGEGDAQLIGRAFAEGLISGAEHEVIKMLLKRVLPRAAAGPVTAAISFFLEMLPYT